MRFHRLAVAVIALGSACVAFGQGPPGQHPADRGHSLMKQGKYQEADDAFAHVGEHDLAYINALTFRGLIAAYRGDLKAGLALMKRAEATDPKRFNKPKNSSYHAVYGRYLSQARVTVPDTVQHVLQRSGVVVAIDGHHTITAFDTASNQAIWSQALGTGFGRLADDAAIAGDSLIAVSRTNDKDELVAFALASGKPVWRIAVAQNERIRIAASDGVVYFSDETNVQNKRSYALRAVTAATGKPRWSRAIAAELGPIAVGGGRVVFRSQDGVMHALRSTDGAPLWELGMPIRVDSMYQDRPVLAGDRVVVVSSDGTVSVLDASDKQYERPLERVLWQKPAARRNAQATPAVVGDIVVVTQRGSVVAFDLTSGAQRWERASTVDGEPLGSVAIGGAVLSHFASGLVLLDAAGTVRWVFRDAFTGGPASPPAAWPEWKPAEAAPAIAADGIWVGMIYSSGPNALHRLAVAPELAY